LDWGKREPVKKEVKGFIQHMNIKQAKSQQKCLKCGHDKFVITDANIHRKLSCASCNSYIKFVNEYEENLLKKKGQIV